VVGLTELTELKNPADYVHKKPKTKLGCTNFFQIHEPNALTGLPSN